ncbi:hypothetical protein ANANG_G00238710 [Anguilla anguilla]|uniref:Uncharacterized protein n=1 Tax=Anguilla anguilla TaxID=7936 RepID=A0A9D3RP93_ANGAN|nr:hypothetical protein ANANG_G00238710 [Anguilla anguilla]
MHSAAPGTPPSLWRLGPLWGILALLILSMVVVKCIRRQQKQEPLSDEQKTDEEGKTDGEGGAEEGTKHVYSLPEDKY